jgi:hypothetical protein
VDLKVVVGGELGNGLRQGGVLEDVVWDALGLADETLLLIEGVGRKGRVRGRWWCIDTVPRVL